MSNRDYQLEKIENYDDEIDLMEIVATLVKEKVTILVTFILVSAIALGVALYERSNAKKAATILSVNLPEEKIKEINFFPVNVMSELYTSENINEKYELTLDEFIKKFKISGITPKEIKNKREFLEKKGESLEYTPSKYFLNLKLKNVEDSKKVLGEYITLLNKDLKNRYESKYQVKLLDIKEFENNDLDYNVYLTSIENDSKRIKAIISNKAKENLNYISYGFNYRDLKIRLENLEEESIKDLKNYLEVVNITRNETTFKDIAKGRIEKLNSLITEKEAIQKDYTQVLNNTKQEKEMNVPNGAKISFEDTTKDSYYAGVIDKKINLLNEITDMKNEKKLLETKLQNSRKGNEKESQSIETLLEEIVNEYNDIVLKFNTLEKKENIINYGEIVKKVTPISITSDSKAKLILAAGLVLGIFAGMGMVFMKVFFKSLNKYMSVFVIFLLVGVNSYSQEVLKFSFTHKEMAQNQNPDRTSFDLKDILVDNFIKDELKIDDIEENEIKIEPIVFPNSYKVAEEKLSNDYNYSYIPTEYKVTLSLKDGEKEKLISEKIKKDFSNYYINYFLKSDIILSEKENLANKDYDVRLNILNNILYGMSEDIKNRKNLEENRGKRNEYDSILYGIEKVKNTMDRELESYIISNNLTSNIERKKTLLSGDKIRLKRSLELVKEKIAFYDEILKSYQLEGKQAVLSENGDITIKGESSVKAKQYFNISNEVLALLEKKNELIRKISEIEKDDIKLKEASKEQAIVINKKFLSLENEIDKIKDRLQILEIINYRQENKGVSISNYVEK